MHDRERTWADWMQRTLESPVASNDVPLVGGASRVKGQPVNPFRKLLNELEPEHGAIQIQLPRCALICLESAAKAEIASYYGQELAERQIWNRATKF